MDTDDGYWLVYPCWRVRRDTPVHNVFAKPFVPPTPTPSSNVEMPASVTRGGGGGGGGRLQSTLLDEAIKNLFVPFVTKGCRLKQNILFGHHVDHARSTFLTQELNLQEPWTHSCVCLSGLL